VAQGNPLEDFESDEAFAALLDGIVAESDSQGAEVELIVNGDAFEMLQVPHVDAFDPQTVYDGQQYHSSSQKDSVRKMALIIAGHPAFFQALGRFLQPGPPRRSVTFVKGNHDLNLHWPPVQDQIRQAVGATGTRAPLLTFEALCISREGIYVEHGNQYAEAVDRVKDMEEPLDPDNPDQLALPLGSWFVMDVFNQVERDKYWIDGVKPITALVWYALAYDFPFAARAIAKLIRALPGVLQEGLFAVEESSAETLAGQLEDPAQVEDLEARYQADADFRAQFNTQVAGILSPTPPLVGVEAVTLPATASPAAMGDGVRQRVASSLLKMADQCAQKHRVKLVTFGHTHDASVEDLPSGGVYINSGTWTWRADLTAAGDKTWRDLFEHPELFTGDRRLSYVRIDYDAAGQPSGRLLTYQPPSEPGSGEEESKGGLASLWQRFLTWLRHLWSGME
jgi:UDP-2,3-diacylglucosamine pyrophosphatase LpxH